MGHDTPVLSPPQEDAGESVLLASGNADRVRRAAPSRGEHAPLTSESTEQVQQGETDIGENALLTSQNTAQDSQKDTNAGKNVAYPTETDDEAEGMSTRTSKRRNPLKEQHRVRIRGLITDLDCYSPQGPEEDLTEEMEVHCGAIKGLQIERRSPGET